MIVDSPRSVHAKYPPRVLINPGGGVIACTVDCRILEPGWAGELRDDELAYIQQELRADKKLSYWWGFAPVQKTRPLEAIRRVAMDGDPERRSVNIPLARPRRAKAGVEVTVGRPNSELLGVR